MALASCMVTGLFAEIGPDSDDPDTVPDRVPLVGLKITIRPNLAENFFTDGEAALLPKIFEGTTDDQGRVCPLGAPRGVVGLPIIASDAVGQVPQSFTHEVEIRTRQGKILSRFHIPAPAGGTVDLVDHVPVAPSPGTGIDDLDEIEARVIVLASRAEEAVLRVESAVANLDDLPSLTLLYENGLV